MNPEQGRHHVIVQPGSYREPLVSPLADHLVGRSTQGDRLDLESMLGLVQSMSIRHGLTCKHKWRDE
jgi:hypothetical protein